MARETFTLTVDKVIKFDSCYGYNTSNYIVKMHDSNNNVYVWKTSTYPWYEESYEGIKSGDVVSVKASVKGESTYKGEKQICLQRCVFTFVGHDSTVEESREAKRLQAQKEKELKKKAQLESVKENDLVMTMEYSRYKKHYPDCETIIDSFCVDGSETSYIDVIIRDGRLKNSGVRGKHYSIFRFYNEDAHKFESLKAISEETARKRLPEGNWTLISAEECFDISLKSKRWNSMYY